MPRRAGIARLGSKKVIKRDLARFDHGVKFPDVGAGTNPFAPVDAIQHRTARQSQCGDIATRSTHKKSRCRLVTAHQEHHSIDRIGSDRFFDIHADQIAEQHRCRPHQGFASRRDWKLKWKTARLENPTLHPLGQFSKMRVTRSQFRPGVADPDYWPAIELVIGNALILHPTAMIESILVGLAKPFGTAAAFIVFHPWGFSNLSLFR